MVMYILIFLLALHSLNNQAVPTIKLFDPAVKTGKKKDRANIIPTACACLTIKIIVMENTLLEFSNKSMHSSY